MRLVKPIIEWDRKNDQASIHFVRNRRGKGGADYAIEKAPGLPILRFDKTGRLMTINLTFGASKHFPRQWLAAAHDPTDDIKPWSLHSMAAGFFMVFDPGERVFQILSARRVGRKLWCCISGGLTSPARETPRKAALDLVAIIRAEKA